MFDHLKDSNGDLRLFGMNSEARAEMVRDQCQPGDEVVLEWNLDSGVRRDFCSTWLEVLSVSPFKVEVRISSTETRIVKSRAVSRIRQNGREKRGGHAEAEAAP